MSRHWSFFVDGARRISQRAQRCAVQTALLRLREWVVQPEANGVLRESLKKGPLPPIDIVRGDQCAFHPRGVIDIKGRVFPAGAVANASRQER
eukprot:2595551-Pyramimonas_sp.AAC.1